MPQAKSEDIIAGKKRPFTGQEYLDSLRDGREIYIYGEQVKDVTTHPAFRNSARTVAKLYDALHDPAQQGALTCPTDTGTGGFTHKFFRVAKSREDLIGQRNAIAHWARMSYGWMGRTPDYKASLMNTLGVNYAFYDKFADNARNWYARAQNHVLFMNHAIVNPPVDRMKAADQVKDVFITIQKETDAGIVVSGAKVVAIAGDITTPAGRAQALAACPNPDILVNNAGGPPPGDFRNWSREDWLKAIDANMLAPIELIKATVDAMIARRFGRIVNITSGAVRMPIPELGLSNGARTGLTGFVAGLARQTVAHNVTINNLLPGPFDTDRLRSNLVFHAQKLGKTPEELARTRTEANPAKRFGTVAEFGDACAFLCSAQAGYITGQNLLLDGGAFPGTL